MLESAFFTQLPFLSGSSSYCLAKDSIKEDIQDPQDKIKEAKNPIFN